MLLYSLNDSSLYQVSRIPSWCGWPEYMCQCEHAPIALIVTHISLLWCLFSMSHVAWYSVGKGTVNHSGEPKINLLFGYILDFLFSVLWNLSNEPPPPFSLFFFYQSAIWFSFTIIPGKTRNLIFSIFTIYMLSLIVIC